MDHPNLSGFARVYLPLFYISAVELLPVKQLLQCWGIVRLLDDDQGAKWL